MKFKVEFFFVGSLTTALNTGFGEAEACYILPVSSSHGVMAQVGHYHCVILIL